MLEYAWLNSHQRPVLKNLLDVDAERAAETAARLKSRTLVDEVPFDFSRRRMSVVCATNQQALLISKAPSPKR